MKGNMYLDTQKLGCTYVSSECTECKGSSTGPEFRNLGGDSELDPGEYIVFWYKKVSGPGQV